MERRRIIIPTDAQPDEPLPSPHFDAEATQTAQRVVPLSEQDAALMQRGGYAKGAAKPFWKRPAVLALVVLVAAGIGVAAGFAIGKFRNRQAAQTPVATTTPTATVENARASQQTVEQPVPTPQPRVAVPEKPAETPANTKEQVPDRTARDDKKGEDKEATPLVVRDNKQDKKAKSNDDQVPDDNQEGRKRRREERRDARRSQREEDAPPNLPRQIDRAGRQINNRIREIFEGQQP